MSAGNCYENKMTVCSLVHRGHSAAAIFIHNGAPQALVGSQGVFGGAAPTTTLRVVPHHHASRGPPPPILGGGKQRTRPFLPCVAERGRGPAEGRWRGRRRANWLGV